MLGGSDAAGVADAADALAELVGRNGSTLGYVNQVKLGRSARRIEHYTAALLADRDEAWLRSGFSGSWEYQIQIAKAAIGYLRTGNEAYLPLLRRELRHWFDHDVHHPKGDAPQMLHGFINTILIPWDLVRDHPSFSAAEVRQIDADFLWTLSSKEGPQRLAGEIAKRQIRNNHGTRTGLDAFFGGRYFARRYHLPQAERWQQIAERYFAVQMDCGKPNEDSWGHQWAASMYNTLVYFLAAGKLEYLHAPGFKLAADRALIAHPNGSTPLGYMSACAAACGDTGYLTGYAPAHRARAAAEMAEGGDEYLRSFYSGRTVVPRTDLLGVAEAPLDRLWYATVDGGPKPGSLFVNSIPAAAGFDKIAIREGWGPDDYYLLLDGLSGGGHSYQDANCIVRYAERGILWCADTYKANQSATVRAQNGVFLAIDAAGPGHLHRAARKLYAGSANDIMAIAAALDGVGDVDWQRHVVRRRGQWTLVIDRAVVHRPGEVLAERHWHIGGRIAVGPDGLTSQVSGRTLHLQTAGVAAAGIRGESDRVETVRALATAERPLEIASLLYVDGPGEKRDVRVKQSALGWRVESRAGCVLVAANAAGDGVTIVDRQGAVAIGRAAAEPAPSYAEAMAAGPARLGATLPVVPECPRVAIPWRTFRVATAAVTAVARSEAGGLAAGDAAGNVVVHSAGGKRGAEVKFPSSILALHFFGDDLLVGEDRGAITRLAADGHQRWQRLIPYVSMAWSNWSEGRSRIREISTADIHGDGRPAILASNSDRRVYALSGDGRELWKTSVEWGVFTAMTPGTYRGQFALLGGTSRPSIFGRCILYGADGKMLTAYSRADLNSWSNPAQFRDLRRADLRGDGQQETITAIDTDCRQVVVYREDGKILWDADVAGAAEALAVVAGEPPRAPSPLVVAASASGYEAAMDGRSGARRWACFVGRPTQFVAAIADGRILAAARSGEVFLIGRDGSLVGAADVGQPITGLLRPGEDRSAGGVLLGTGDGRLLALP
jgi:outer membrane protein assembly factor BamB